VQFVRDCYIDYILTWFLQLVFLFEEWEKLPFTSSSKVRYWTQWLSSPEVSWLYCDIFCPASCFLWNLAKISVPDTLVHCTIRITIFCSWLYQCIERIDTWQYKCLKITKCPLFHWVWGGNLTPHISLNVILFIPYLLYVKVLWYFCSIICNIVNAENWNLEVGISFYTKNGLYCHLPQQNKHFEYESKSSKWNKMKHWNFPSGNVSDLKIKPLWW
jgi:hypothetical protein